MANDAPKANQANQANQAHPPELAKGPMRAGEAREPGPVRNAVSSAGSSTGASRSDATLKDRLARAYAERNALAVGFIQLALARGWPAGRAMDPNPKRDWGPDWRHMLCVQLPSGQLLQWHLSPDALPLIKGVPAYKGSLVGQNLAWKLNWPEALANALAFGMAEAITKGDSAPRGPSLQPSHSSHDPAEPPSQPSSPSSLRDTPARVKASYWGPKTFRVEECASVSAALNWLIRNRHTVVKDAQIEEPGRPVRTYTSVLLSELAVKMGGRSLVKNTQKPENSEKEVAISRGTDKAVKNPKSMAPSPLSDLSLRSPSNAVSPSNSGSGDILVRATAAAKMLKTMNETEVQTDK